MSELIAALFKWTEYRNNSLKIVIFLIPIPLILGFIWLKIRWPEVYFNMIQEDSCLENMQFLVYGAGAIMAVFFGHDAMKKGHFVNGLILLALGLMLALASLEEISWGQRLFMIASPEWFQKNNLQKEITLHNLRPVQEILARVYVLIGLFFSFWWIPVRLLTSIKKLNPNIKDTLLLYRPGWYLMLYFAPTVAIYGYFVLTENIGRKMLHWLGQKPIRMGQFIIHRDQEPAELLLALGLLLFIITVVIRMRSVHGRAQPRNTSS